MKTSPMRILLLLVLVSGCASNAITLDTAREVTATTTAAVATARESLAASRQARIETNAALIASDGSCPASVGVLLYVPKDGSAVPETICAFDNSAAAARDGFDIVAMQLVFITDENIAPMIALTGAMADYSAAILKVLDRPGVDISGELTSVIEKAKTVTGLIGAIGGAGATDAVSSAEAALQSAQGAAAIKLIQFVAELADEAQRVEDIRAHVLKNGAEFEKMVADLKEKLEAWDKTQTSGDAITRKAALQIAYDGLRSGKEFDYDKRVLFVRRVLEAELEIQSAPKRRAGLSAVLTEVEEIHATLRRELAGQFDEAKQRKIAKENQSRILKAAGLIAETAAQFGAL